MTAATDFTAIPDFSAISGFAAIPDYAAILRDGQQAFRNAADAYAKTLQTAIAELPKLPTTAALPEVTDVQAGFDRLYDHAREVVEIQRGLVKELITAGK